jgi:hypothetical protein
MFALIYEATPPTVSPGNGTFYVGSLPGASCRLYRLPVTGDSTLRRSGAFTIDSTGWYLAAWGSSWPVSNVTVSVYATCTAAASATSPTVLVLWPAHATPSP